MGGRIRRCNPADTALGMLHDQADRRVECGRSDGHKGTGIRASAIPILPGNELPERIRPLKVCLVDIAHGRCELRHFNEALATRQADKAYHKDRAGIALRVIIGEHDRAVPAHVKGISAFLQHGDLFGTQFNQGHGAAEIVIDVDLVGIQGFVQFMDGFGELE